MTGKRLTNPEIEQIKILRASGLTFHAISVEIQRDPKSIKNICLKPLIASEIMEIQEELADAYDGLARRMIESITDEDIRKLNAYQRTIAAGICTDKTRLLNNQSTENISIENIEINRGALKEKKIALEKKLQNLTRGKRQKVLESKPPLH